MGAGFSFAANAAQLCRPAMPASTRTCAAARRCRLKPSPIPNKKADPVGAGFLFGSGGALCTLATAPQPLAVLEVPLIAA